MRKKTAVILGLILLLAFVLRLWGLNKLELFGDELDVGYQAYSILKTGRDIRGFRFPVYLRSLSESRAPLFLYSATPFVAVFGLNELGVRLTAVFWGILNILFLFWLVKLLFKNEKIALFSALILSVVPWHIHYSRAGFEVTLLLSLILLGTIFFIKGKNDRKYLFFSSIVFGLSFYTYNTANLFVPLLIIVLFILFIKKIKGNGKNILINALVFIAIIFPLGLRIIQGQASSRFKQISIFSDQKIIDSVILKRNLEKNPLIGRVFYNKLTIFSFTFGRNYLVSFSPQFLFFDGDPNPRHSVPGFGEFYLVLLVPLLVGLGYLIKNFGKDEILLLLAWTVLSPLGSALTSDGASHATRLFLLLPPLIIIMAIGLYETLNLKKGKYFGMILGFILLFNILRYAHDLITHFPKEQYRYWHYGYKEIMLALNNNRDLCSKVFVNNTHEPFLIRYLFWGKIDPAWFHENFKGDQRSLTIDKLFNGFKLGDIYFGSIIEVDKLSAIVNLLSNNNGSCYIAFQQDEIPGDWNLEKNPSKELKVLKLVKTPFNEPYIYLLTKN